MKIVKHGTNEHWICTQEFVALVSYTGIIALQSINTNELVVTRDKLSKSSKKHLNHLKRTCSNYMITDLPQRDLSYKAIELINDTDNDPITTDDNMMYTWASILGESYALELLERYHGINPVNGRRKHNILYTTMNDYAILFTGSIYLYFEGHR